MLLKFFIFIFGTAIGILITYYHRWFVRMIGTNSWAEKVFGSGGTYTLWQLIGVLVIILSALFTFGGLDRILGI